MFARSEITSLSLTASLLVGIALKEGYAPVATEPVKGDVATYGFGTTENVKLGDKISVERALILLLNDANKKQTKLKECVKVPLYQYEFDAYTSLSYNIGTGAFCNSTLVKKLNVYDYEGACKEILKWKMFKGKTLLGLTKRRQEEYRMCIND